MVKNATCLPILYLLTPLEHPATSQTEESLMNIMIISSFRHFFAVTCVTLAFYVIAFPSYEYSLRLAWNLSTCFLFCCSRSELISFDLSGCAQSASWNSRWVSIHPFLCSFSIWAPKKKNIAKLFQACNGNLTNKSWRTWSVRLKRPPKRGKIAADENIRPVWSDEETVTFLTLIHSLPPSLSIYLLPTSEPWGHILSLGQGTVVP